MDGQHPLDRRQYLTVAGGTNGAVLVAGSGDDGGEDGSGGPGEADDEEDGGAGTDGDDGGDGA